MNKHLSQFVYILSMSMIALLSSCTNTLTGKIMKSDPIKPLLMKSDSQLVYVTDYVPLLVAEKRLPETMTVISTGHIGNIRFNEKPDCVDIVMLPDKPVKRAMVTMSYDAQSGTIQVGLLEPLENVTLCAYAQNRRLEDNSITSNQDGSYSISLNAVPRAIRNLDTWYLRIYGETDEFVLNDLLIPMHQSHPIMDVNKLNRHMPHTQVLYSVLVDRFFNGNTANDWKINDPEVLDIVDYQGGDLAGITQAIESGYFDSLGINTLWISPLSQNPYTAWGYYPFPNGNKYDPSKKYTKFSAYHGYWPIYITGLEKRFGTEDEFRTLLATAHEHGINVILDYVANHMHIESPTFQEHPDWHTDSILPDGRRNFELWDDARLTTWFDKHIPTLDLEREEVREAMTDSALIWLEKYDLDGFRHDACKHIPESYWRLFGQKIASRFPDRAIWMIGETYGSPELINLYVKTGMLDAQFDFNVYFTSRAALCSSQSTMRDVEQNILTSLDTYGSHHTMGNISGNHDQIRFASIAGGAIDINAYGKEEGWTQNIGIGDATKAYRRALLLEVLNMTIPGVPCIYQGDEYAEVGGNDPDNRHMMRFGNELTEAEKAFRQKVRELINLRRSHMAFLYGEFIPVYADDDVLVYERQYMGERFRIRIDRETMDYSIVNLSEAPNAAQFAKGADISWLSEMEACDVPFYDLNGQQADLMDIVRNNGCNAIRLRVWLNPRNGYSNKEDMVALAKRAQAKGMSLMVDFHYSDHWADPGQQYAPKAWENMSITEMSEALAAHTRDVLEALRAEDITPLWVQVGNETSTGMCWPIGCIFNEDWSNNEGGWVNYAQLTNAGYDAVKAVFPEAVVIVHHDNAFNTEGLTWFYDKLQAHGGKWDMIGLSHYPTTQPKISWQEMNRLAAESIDILHERYDCPIMLVEIGTDGRDEQLSFRIIDDMRLRTEAKPFFKGYFYWEPESYNYKNDWFWNGYDKGAFTPEGQPNKGLLRLWH